MASRGAFVAGQAAESRRRHESGGVSPGASASSSGGPPTPLAEKAKVVAILMAGLLLLFLLRVGMSGRENENAGPGPGALGLGLGFAGTAFGLADDAVMEAAPSPDVSENNMADVAGLQPDLEPDELAEEEEDLPSPDAEQLAPGEIPGVPRSISLLDGRLSNAFQAPQTGARTRLELPRIFAFPGGAAADPGRQPRTVCVFTRTPRQDSLFGTNILAQFGSGDFRYEVMRSTDCQHQGTCASAEEARSHPSCDPDMMPTVHLLERIKNFQHERFEQVLSNGASLYDVLVATGDEFCRATNTTGRAHFRMYAGPNVVNPSRKTPVYLPLGPREEMTRVAPAEVRLVRQRRFVFNFLGSLTSFARKELLRQVRSRLGPVRKFVHVTAKWKKQLTRQNGYVPPAQYRAVLLNSVFTLCPQGHNPEAFRIFEACEAGSIPIVAMDRFYRRHECKAAYKPLIMQGAPFVFLESWEELPAFLAKMAKDPAKVQQMQIDTMEWYARFMRKVANNFETVLSLRFQDRMDQGKFTSTASIPSIEAYLDDPKYTKPL